MATEKPRRTLGRSLAGASAVGLLVLAVAHASTWSLAPDLRGSPAVITEPAVFVGLVQVTRDAEHGVGVLISTATEEVWVAEGAVAQALARFEGELVAVRGRLIESPEAPPTLEVRAFRVLGGDPGAGPDDRLVSTHRSVAC